MHDFRHPLIVSACLLALAAAGCGGGAGQQGQTVAGGAAPSSTLLACVDANRNGQCDDADTSHSIDSAADTGLSPAPVQRVLVETRDARNARSALLISDPGSAQADGLSTLRALLGLAPGSALEQALLATGGAQVAQTLEAGFAASAAADGVMLPAMARFAAAVQAQATATPTLAPFAPVLGAPVAVAGWDDTTGGDASQPMTVHASKVLGNDDRNRLFILDSDAAQDAVSEIDLLPAPPPLALAHKPPTNRWLAALDRVVSIFVDTASAASSVSGVPTSPPVELTTGQGIAAAQITRDGAEAVVLLNLQTGQYNDASCAQGREGIYRVPLSGPDATRALASEPVCAHSGFALLAADPAGASIAAWDTNSRTLWSIDGATMKERAVMSLQIDAPQALAVSPGGRFAALATPGRVEIVDLLVGHVVANLSGPWVDVHGMAFAGGVRRLVIGSGDTLHVVAFDEGMRWIDTRSTSLDGPLRSFAVAPDGDSLVVATDAGLSWRTVETGDLLAAAPLPTGLDVQHVAAGSDHLVLTGLRTAQARFEVDSAFLPLAPVPQ